MNQNNRTTKPHPRPHPCPRHDDSPALVFDPLAWLKLQMLLHLGETEIAGFGISSELDLLGIDRFETVRQKASACYVEMDDAAVADHFDRCVDAGLFPQCFARIWIHTHPGTSAMPSMTDEQTFERVFGDCDWAVMCILARGGASYARLRFSAGPGGELLIPVRVDWSAWPQVLMQHGPALPEVIAGWEREYHENVQVEQNGWSRMDDGKLEQGLMELHERQYREQQFMDFYEWMEAEGIEIPEEVTEQP
jgi:proteasome lid subunit RPN8/RPN11